MIKNLLNTSSLALCHEDFERLLSGKMDRVTIYRILQGFCDEGKVHKIIADNGKTYYAVCQNCSEHQHHDNHMHFKCMRCGGIQCMDQVIEIPSLPEGYIVLNILCIASGYCPNCLMAGE